MTNIPDSGWSCKSIRRSPRYVLGFVIDRYSAHLIIVGEVAFHALDENGAIQPLLGKVGLPEEVSTSIVNICVSECRSSRSTWTPGYNQGSM